MAAARDKLIAEWHERLAAAEAADTSSLSRPAWLARLQIRLYRFLLSLYGDGDWTTTPPRRTNSPPNAEGGDDSVVFDSPTALPLAGKPPKSLGQIQAVLKTVANAQSHAPAAGPFTQGLTPECWVTVALAASEHRYKAFRLASALNERGIEAREYQQGRRFVVEVRARDFDEAMRIAREPPRRRVPPRVVVTRQLEPGPLAPYLKHAIVIGAIVGAAVGLVVAMWLDVQLRIANPRSPSWLAEPSLWAAFGGAWVLFLIVVVMGVVVLDFSLAAVRDRFRQKQPGRGSLGAFFLGLAWHGLAAGVLIGPFIGLFAVGVLGNLARGYEPLVFFGGWVLSILASGALYLDREV